VVARLRPVYTRAAAVVHGSEPWRDVAPFLLCQVPLVSLPPPCCDVDIDDDNPPDEPEERTCPLGAFDLPVLPDGASEEERAARLTVAEVALRMLDWMGDHKSTWEQANGCWDMLKTMLPIETELCVFSRVKAILVAHLDSRLKRIEVCPCGYTVYINCTSTAFANNKYRNAHRTQCPRRQCRLSRYLPGIMPPVARKVRVIKCVDGYSRVSRLPSYVSIGNVLLGDYRLVQR
jgi:hypothetical protein